MKHSDLGARKRGSAPLECPALEMMVVDGELTYRRVRWRRDYVTDATEAIRLLRQGITIWAFQSAPLINKIQREFAG